MLKLTCQKPETDKIIKKKNGEKKWKIVVLQPNQKDHPQKKKTCHVLKVKKKQNNIVEKKNFNIVDFWCLKFVSFFKKFFSIMKNVLLTLFCIQG